MSEKSSLTRALLLLLLLSTVLVIPESAFAQFFPAIFLEVKPQSQTVQAGSSATLNLTLYPQGPWYTWNVTFSLLNPPQGVTATFNPKNTSAGGNDFTSVMTVNVASDVLQGNRTLAIHWNGTVSRSLGPNTTPYRFDLNSTTNATLNITAPEARTTTANTITTTTTTTSTSTITLTNTTTERVSDPSIYAWAVGATVAAVVLATIVVLLLRRTR